MQTTRVRQLLVVPGIEVADLELERPAIQLYRGVKRWPELASTLLAQCVAVESCMETLDEAPRHDTVLDAKTLQQIYQYNYQYLNGLIDRHLSLSLNSLEDALSRIENSFRGEQKVKYLDRLSRHAAEAKALRELFQDLPIERPTQPYAIRRSMLSDLHIKLCEALDVVAPLRRKLKGSDAAKYLVDVLLETETELYRLRSIIGKWRDNPSQKLGLKFGSIVERLIVISENATKLKQNAQFECQELGAKFSNRNGPSVVEKAA